MLYEARYKRFIAFGFPKAYLIHDINSNLLPFISITLESIQSYILLKIRLQEKSWHACQLSFSFDSEDMFCIFKPFIFDPLKLHLPKFEVNDTSHLPKVLT